MTVEVTRHSKIPSQYLSHGGMSWHKFQLCGRPTYSAEIWFPEHASSHPLSSSELNLSGPLWSEPQNCKADWREIWSTIKVNNKNIFLKINVYTGVSQVNHMLSWYWNPWFMTTLDFVQNVSDFIKTFLLLLHLGTLNESVKIPF